MMKLHILLSLSGILFFVEPRKKEGICCTAPLCHITWVQRSSDAADTDAASLCFPHFVIGEFVFTDEIITKLKKVDFVTNRKLN